MVRYTFIMISGRTSSSLHSMARVGFVAKGLLYLLVGVLAYMAAFEIGGQSNKEGGKAGAFKMILELPAGRVLLGAVAIGLLCYAAWRLVQVFSSEGNEGDNKKKIGKRMAYFLSALAYLSFAFLALKTVTGSAKEEGGAQQDLVARLLNLSYGQVLLIIAALTIAAVGIYQFWFGYSGKFKKHVSTGAAGKATSSVLEKAGKLGYAARGIVWLIISWLLISATIHHNSREAGDTSKAFQFLEDASYGSYLLGAVGFGLACYGVFNFLRARFENFN
ncbi:MAG: DUF1206 domain-containing protein [Chitinophagaceae bacterium]